MDPHPGAGSSPTADAVRRRAGIRFLWLAVLMRGLAAAADIGALAVLGSSAAVLADFGHNGVELVGATLLAWAHTWKRLPRWLRSQWMPRIAMLVTVVWLAWEGGTRVHEATFGAGGEIDTWTVALGPACAWVFNLSGAVLMIRAGGLLASRSLRLEGRHQRIDARAALWAVVALPVGELWDTAIRDGLAALGVPVGDLAGGVFDGLAALGIAAMMLTAVVHSFRDEHRRKVVLPPADRRFLGRQPRAVRGTLREWLRDLATAPDLARLPHGPGVPRVPQLQLDGCEAVAITDGRDRLFVQLRFETGALSPSAPVATWQPRHRATRRSDTPNRCSIRISAERSERS